MAGAHQNLLSRSRDFSTNNDNYRAKVAKQMRQYISPYTSRYSNNAQKSTSTQGMNQKVQIQRLLNKMKTTA